MILARLGRFLNSSKPDAYWLKAIQDPQGKSRGRYDVAIHFPTKHSPTPSAMAGFFIASALAYKNAAGQGCGT